MKKHAGGEPKKAVAKASPRVHHWLVAGKILFTTGEEAEVGSFEHNTMITNTKNFVTANMIGVAQQQLQMELFSKLQDPTMKIVNVHIATVNYLGAMSKEEFYTPPPVADEAAPVDEKTAPAEKNVFDIT